MAGDPPLLKWEEFESKYREVATEMLEMCKKDPARLNLCMGGARHDEAKRHAARLYSLVYTACTQPPPNKHTSKIYAWLPQLVRELWMPPCAARHVLYETIYFSAKYIDRLYAISRLYANCGDRASIVSLLRDVVANTDGEAVWDCAICLNSNNETSRPSCSHGHHFHDECIASWIAQCGACNAPCPLCREILEQTTT